MHRWAHWCFPWFFYILIDAVLHVSLDTLTFTVVLYTLFDAVFCAPFDKLVFSLFLYMLFDELLHAPLDTLVFSLFCTHCLMQCYMIRWTQWCFP